MCEAWLLCLGHNIVGSSFRAHQVALVGSGVAQELFAARVQLLVERLNLAEEVLVEHYSCFLARQLALIMLVSLLDVSSGHVPVMALDLVAACAVVRGVLELEVLHLNDLLQLLHSVL